MSWLNVLLYKYETINWQQIKQRRIIQYIFLIILLQDTQDCYYYKVNLYLGSLWINLKIQ